MKILVVRPGEQPCIEEIEHSLEQMQKVVGGYIQPVYPYQDPVAVICDEEGLLKRYPPNRNIPHVGIIFGTFFVCGNGETEFTDIPDNLIDKYMKTFQL